MINKFPHAGESRGSLITWAKQIVEEAYSLDPIFMDERAVDIFGFPDWSWVAAETTEAKIHAICRAAMIVRLRACG